MDEPLSTHKKAPHLSEDEATLYLIASGLTLLAQEIDKGTPLALPYPASLQRGLNRLTIACLRQSQTLLQSLPHLFTWCHTPIEHPVLNAFELQKQKLTLSLLADQLLAAYQPAPTAHLVVGPQRRHRPIRGQHLDARVAPAGRVPCPRKLRASSALQKMGEVHSILLDY